MRNIGRMALLVLAVNAAMAAEKLGDRWVVVGIVGKWKTVADAKPLYLGQPLAQGTAFVRDPPAARSGSITLAFDKDARVTHACENAGDCAKPFEVTPPPKREAASTSFREVLAAWVERPKTFIAAVSRDVGSLHDAVVPSSGAGADLTALVSGLGKGTYWLKIERLQPGSDEAVPVGSGPTMLTWDPERKSSGTVAGLAPGLYRLQMSNREGEATGGDAWALVRTAGDYAKAQAAFQQIVDQTAAWTEDVPPAGIRAIHRARLEMLAR